MTEKDELDDFLDEALGKLGGILGEMGYAMPDVEPTTLECPSGQLLVCDIAALPRRGSPAGRIIAGGKAHGKARGAIVPWGETALAGIRDALPGSVRDLLLVERQVPAVRERTRAIIAPVTGIFLIGDATLLGGLKRSPRRVPRAPEGETFGALETVTRIAAERGARLGPTAMGLLLHTARTGLWRGVLHGRDALAVSLGHRHVLRLREGLDADGQRSYLRFDAGRDGVLADPKLRALAKTLGD